MAHAIPIDFSQMKKILLLGGTGAIGASLAAQIAMEGWEVSITSRQPREDQWNMTYIVGNARDEEFLANVLNDHFDVIVDFMIYQTEDFRGRVQKLLDSCSQYVYLSSARVYADSQSPLTEESPRLLDVCEDKAYIRTDEYALTKARQEDILRDSNRTNWTIIRPYITYSDIRLQLGVLEKEAWLYRALHGRTLVFSEDISKCATTLTNGEDVSRAMARLIGEPAACGEIFHVTAESCGRWETVLELYRETLAENGFQLNVKLVDLDTFTRCHNGKYQIQFDRLYNRVFDNAKIKQFVDVSAFEGINSGLKRCLSDFLGDCHFRDINWSCEGARDKVTREFTNLREIDDFNSTLRYLKYRFIK